MKLKLAVIDIDGVIVDATKRFQEATTDGKIDWDKALNSNALHLDSLIPHSIEDLTVISEQYGKIVLLTSRYDHMAHASLAWLKEHGITFYDQAIFKPWAHRYTKTKVWKAQQVINLLQEANHPNLWSIPCAPVTSLLVVDDDEANLQEIRQEMANWIMANRGTRAYYFDTLQEATKYLKQGENN